MSKISKSIDIFLREYVDPVLRAAGFRKKGRRYSRILTDRVELLIVEASSWNRFDTGTFSIGLAIVIPELALRLRSIKVELLKAKGFESGIHENLGFLLPEQHPDSWCVQINESNTEEGERVRSAVVEHALPWYEKARSEDGLMEVLENSRSMESLEVRAILYSDMLNFSGVRSMLGEIVRRRPDLNEYVANWAKERGLFAEEQ